MSDEATGAQAPRRSRWRFWRRLALGVLLLLVAALVIYGLIPGRQPAPDPTLDPSQHRVVAVFGSTGTAGDGVLEAMLADPGVETIHVITRRTTPRIDAGVAAGRVRATIHLDYEDYGAIASILPDLDAVYWALGTSALNVDDQKYSVIHVDFPLAFVRTWLQHQRPGPRSFHLISGQGASEDASSHWAREKARAERELFTLVEGTQMRVVSYRPPYIAPASERAHLGHDLLSLVFGPAKLAIRSTAIGQAMLEVTARGAGELPSGTILENKAIFNYAAAYEQRG